MTMATIHDVSFWAHYTNSGWSNWEIDRKQYEVPEGQIPLLMRHPLVPNLSGIAGDPDAEPPWIPQGMAAASVARAVFRYLLTDAGWQLIATESNYGPNKYKVV